MAISNNIKQLRKERNINQDTLAQAIGSCNRSISRFECGDRTPSLEIAIRIAKYFDVPVESVFDVDGV